ALLVEEPREEAADVAESLHGDAHAGERAVLLRDGIADAEEASARGCLLAPERAADRERLAGHDAQHGMALVHRVRVEHPRHHRAVGADIGSRDVLLRADLVDDLARVAAGATLELAAP